MEEKITGGEMEFDLSATGRPKVNSLTDLGTSHASGRAALYAILMALSRKGINNILLPEYICPTVVTTVTAAGFTYRYYRIDEEFRPDINDVAAKADDASAVLVVNYFGLQNLTETIRAIKSRIPSGKIIEDDVQAFFSYISRQSPVADYSFTSLRKWFPVPDGGLARSLTDDITSPGEQNGFWDKKLSGLVLKGLRDSLGSIDKVYLGLLREGEELIDKSLSATGSAITRAVIERTDFIETASIRRNNSAVILSGLADIGLEPMIRPDSDSVPFFIPVRLDDRDSVRRELFRHNIFCPVHWPADDVITGLGTVMSEQELSIIIDQRYGLEDMERILEVLSTAIRQS